MFVIQKHGATITSAVAQMEDLLPELPTGPYKQQFEYTTTGPFVTQIAFRGPTTKVIFRPGRGDLPRGQRVRGAPDPVPPSLFDPPKTAPQGAAGVFAIAASIWEKQNG